MRLYYRKFLAPIMATTICAAACGALILICIFVLPPALHEGKLWGIPFAFAGVFLWGVFLAFIPAVLLGVLVEWPLQVWGRSRDGIGLTLHVLISAGAGSLIAIALARAAVEWIGSVVPLALLGALGGVFSALMWSRPRSP